MVAHVRCFARETLWIFHKFFESRHHKMKVTWSIEQKQELSRVTLTRFFHFMRRASRNWVIDYNKGYFSSYSMSMSISKFSFWNADGNFDWYYENCCLKLLLFESLARASTSSCTQSVCDLLEKKKKKKKAWRWVSLFVPFFYNYWMFNQVKRKWSLFTVYRNLKRGKRALCLVSPRVCPRTLSFPPSRIHALKEGLVNFSQSLRQWFWSRKPS